MFTWSATDQLVDHNHILPTTTWLPGYKKWQ